MTPTNATESVMPSRDGIPKARLVTDQLERPSVDDRTYRVIRLRNELEVLLVHDPETDKASAAMDVNVGSYSDEPDMPGMAHAVEHLLFMGTKTYPVENDYSQYLSSNSGCSNAYTGGTSTNFYFEIAAKPSNDKPLSASNPSPLRGALDRFSKFFIEPLFLASTLDRELQAVDSEHKKNLQDDGWRFPQLDKLLSNPDHPYSNFGTGTLEVLKTLPEARGVNVRDKFIEFHSKHYSANLMKLVVLGREPLELLEEWAVDLFSDVPNKNLEQKNWTDQPPWRESDLAVQFFMKPVTDSRSVTLRFPIPDETWLFEEQPSRYMSHLIGHEGPGSLMAYIKSKGWVTALNSCACTIAPGSPYMFHCGIRLTEAGLEHYQEVLEAFFRYVSLLRENAPEHWIWEEQKNIADVNFKFREKTPASNFTSEMSSVMQDKQPPEWLLSTERLRKFDPASIRACIDCLTPDNLRLSFLSQNFPGEWDQKEPWYGTEYKHERIPDALLDRLRGALHAPVADHTTELHLPHRNAFLPTKLEVDKREVKEPVIGARLVRNDSRARVWWKKDDTFWVPRANVIALLRSGAPMSSPGSYVRASILVQLVKDALEEYSYDAQIAGLDYSVGADSDGLVLDLSGYNDKLAVLLEQVLLKLRDIEIRQDRFDVVVDRLRRHYHNSQLQPPYTLLGEQTSWLTAEHNFTTEDCGAELPGITPASVAEFKKQLLGQFHVEVLVMGNLSREEALACTALIESVLKPRVLPRTQWPVGRTLLLPRGCNFVYEKTHKDPDNVNHAIEYYMALGDRGDPLLRAKAVLLEQILEEPAFDRLRTKEQLGYVVFSGVRAFETRYGIRFLIQSERTPQYLESRIHAFLHAFSATLRDMPADEFERHKNSVVLGLLEKHKNLIEECVTAWTNISNGYYNFWSSQNVAEVVKTLTKEDIIQIWDEAIHPDSAVRSKLSVHFLALGRLTPDDKISEVARELGLDRAGTLRLKAVLLQSEKRHDLAGLEEHLIYEMHMPLVQVSKVMKLARESQAAAQTNGAKKDDVDVDAGTDGVVVDGGSRAEATGDKKPGDGDAAPEKPVDGDAAPEKPAPPCAIPAVYINDVIRWKGSLEVSKAPAPVKEFSEYMDVNP